jgi:hypothetical protein
LVAVFLPAFLGRGGRSTGLWVPVFVRVATMFACGSNMDNYAVVISRRDELCVPTCRNFVGRAVTAHNELMKTPTLDVARTDAAVSL